MADQYEPLAPMDVDPAPKPAAVQRSTPACSQTPQNYFDIPPAVPPQSPGVEQQKSINFVSRTAQGPTVAGGQSSSGQTGKTTKKTEVKPSINVPAEDKRTLPQVLLMRMSLVFGLFVMLVIVLVDLALIFGLYEGPPT